MKGFRTIAFNVLGGLLPIFESIDFTNLLEGDQWAWYVLFMAIGNAVLRFLTTTSVFKSE